MNKDHRYTGSVRSDLLEEELFPALFESCAAFYRVDLATQQYKTLKQSPALSSRIQNTGNIQDLFKSLIYPYKCDSHPDCSYEALLSAAASPGQKCSRRVLHEGTDSFLLLQVSCLPVPDQETLYITVMVLGEHVNVRLFDEQDVELNAEEQILPEMDSALDTDDLPAAHDRSLMKPHISGSVRVLDQMEKYIHEHYMEKLTLGKLGKLFYMNSAYLGQLFFKRYKITFNEYLSQERLSHAVTLLENTDRLVYEIAAEVGYSTLNYFIKQFTAHYGISPAKYRKLYLAGADMTQYRE